jgi:hemerythrin
MMSDAFTNDPPPALEWSEKFATGIRAIDNDHRGLFEEFRILSEQLANAAGPGDAAPVIASLKLYVSEHFDREEMFMENAHYPDIEAHKQEHRRAASLIDELDHIYRADPGSVDGSKVAEFLGKWLAGHILGSDMKYVPFLIGEAKGPSPETSGAATAEPQVPIDTTELQLHLPPEKVETVRHFAEILADGGKAATALVEAVEQISAKRLRATHESARKLFCRD